MTEHKPVKKVSTRQYERLRRWVDHKPAFALMGEFSAGKSTLINFLLQQEALPTQVTATQLPPVWFSWGEPRAYTIDNDGHRQEIDLEDIHTVGVEGARFIRIFLKAEILETIDLIDTPGISDPKISTDVWARAIGQAAGVLWCTHSTQAWRETERATWTSFPDRIHQNSLLLVTRSDVLGPKDRQKVLRRVNREAGHLFHRTVLFSARDAVMAKSPEDDAELWAKSGSDKVFESLFGLAEAFSQKRQEVLKRFKSDNTIAEADPRVQTEDAEASGISPIRVMPRSPNRAAVSRARLAPDKAKALRETVRPAEIEETPSSFDSTEVELREFFKAEPEPPLELTEPLNFPKKHIKEDPLEVSSPEEGLSHNFESEVMVEPSEPEDVHTVEDTAEPLILSDDNSDESNESPEPEQGQDEDTIGSLLKTLSLEDEDSFSVSENILEKADDDHDDVDIVEPAKELVEPVDLEVGLITSMIGSDEGENNIRLVSPAAETIASEENNSETEKSEETPKNPAFSEPSEADAVEVTYSEPLSAAQMWSEIVKTESISRSAEDLLEVFAAFLNEYDKINAEQHAQKTAEELQSIPRAGSQRNAEWHVL